MKKISLANRIAGRFTYHTENMEERPLSLRNKSPFHRTNLFMGGMAVFCLMLTFIVSGEYLSRMLPIMAGVFALCSIFAILAQFSINRDNDAEWHKQLLAKYKNHQMWG